MQLMETEVRLPHPFIVVGDQGEPCGRRVICGGCADQGYCPIVNRRLDLTFISYNIVFPG